MPKLDSIDVIMSDPAFLDYCIKVMKEDPDIDEDYLVPFSPDEEDEDGNPIVHERKGDYGDMVKYVPVKYVRERAEKAFKRKYSFLIVAEKREDEPFERKRYNRDDDDYESVDGDKYLKCIGMMVVPGLGVKMAYGVKKVRGGAESSDWKACQSDAFKKCCEQFGIYLDYELSDDDDEDSGSRSGRSGGGKNRNAKDLSDLDLSDVEYDDDTLAEAGEYEIDFGKYKGYTLSEIQDEDDTSYLIYLYTYDGKGGDEEAQEYAGILLKAMQDEENSKSNRRKAKGTSKKASGKRDSGSSSSRSGSGSRGKGKANSAADNKKKEKLIAVCEEALEDCDKLTRRSYIQSVSTSDAHPRGKRELEDLTVRELEELAEVLADEE